MRRPGPGVRRAALVLLLLAGLSLAVLSLAGQWSEVRAGARELSLAYVLLAGLSVILSYTFSLLSWRAVLAGVGVEVPLRPAARIFFVGQLGKYVPGSVWPVLAQMELGAGYGLSRAAVGTSGLLALAVALPVALTIGLLTVPVLVGEDGRGYLLLFLALPLAALAMSPPVLNPVLDRALRVLRRPPLPQRLTGGMVLAVAGWSVVAHLLLGLATWLLARDLGATGAEALPLAVGAFSLASAAGLLAVPVPAGAGVREAVLVVTLSPVLPVGQALLLAIVLRALLTAGDVTVATLSARGTGQTGMKKTSRGSDDRGRPRSS